MTRVLAAFTGFWPTVPRGERKGGLGDSWQQPRICWVITAQMHVVVAIGSTICTAGAARGAL